MHLRPLLALALAAGAAILTAAVPSAQAQCLAPTPADYAAFPSAVRTIQPEALFAAGTPTACPGGTNTSPCGAHRIYLPDPANPALRPDQVMVFLAGSSSEPNKYDELLSMAAFAGYRTIGLSYDNSTSMTAACGNTCTCYGAARREVLHGTSITPAVTILDGDSVVTRLHALFVHLDATYPAEGWGAFLGPDDGDGVAERGDLDWSRIVLSGHSQGAGHALLLAKLEAVDGLVVFDGGHDECTTGGRTYAQWHDLPDLGMPRRTFNHDRGGTFALPGSFLAMLFGAASTDFALLDAAWPTAFLAATTDQAPPATCTEHGSMAYDGCMPTTVSSAAVPATAGDAYLFPFYVQWMCEVGN